MDMGFKSKFHNGNTVYSSMFENTSCSYFQELYIILISLSSNFISCGSFQRVMKCFINKLYKQTILKQNIKMYKEI